MTVYWNGFLTPVAALAGEDDQIAYRVRLAAREIGRTAAAALVACVAALNVEDSEVVSERLDELTALSENPLPDDSADDYDDAVAIDDSADLQMNGDDAQPASTQAAEAHTANTVEELLASAAELREGADALAELLRNAAEDVRSGRPAQLAGSALDAWSDSVHALLAEAHATVEAGDLSDLEAGLQLVLDQRASRQSSAAEALKDVEYLISRGLDAVVPNALRERGFETLEEVRRVAGLRAAQDTNLATQTGSDTKPEPDDDLNKPNTGDDTGDAGATQGATEEQAVPDDESPSDVTVGTDPSTAHAFTRLDSEEPPGSDDDAEQLSGDGEGIEQNDRTAPGLRDEEVSAAPETSTATAATAAADDVAPATPSVEPQDDLGHACGHDPDSADAATVSEDLSAELAEHVRAGRFGAAWFIAQAAGLPDLDAAAYRLASAAFHSGPGALDPSEVLISITTAASDDGGFSCESARVALAATLRVVRRPVGPRDLELESIASQANLGAGRRPLIDATIAAGDRGYRHVHGVSDRAALSIHQLHDRAHAIRDELSSTRIRFARADKVLRYLLRTTEPIGAAFKAVLAPTTGDERRRHLATALAHVDDPDAVIETADVAVSTAQQRKYAIESYARTKLRRAIESAAQCAEALNAAVVSASDNRAAANDETLHNGNAAVKDVAAGDNEDGPGVAVMNLLVQWIHTPEAPSGTAKNKSSSPSRCRSCPAHAMRSACRTPVLMR